MADIQFPNGVKPAQLLQTVPHDPHNPNTNQAKHCYYKYNEFFRCEKFHGEGAKECYKFKQAYFSLCPNDWFLKQVQKWDEQRAAGNFPGPL